MGREVLDVPSVGAGEARWFELPGPVAGWSSDGKWLYLYGRFEGR